MDLAASSTSMNRNPSKRSLPLLEGDSAGVIVFGSNRRISRMRSPFDGTLVLTRGLAQLVARVPDVAPRAPRVRSDPAVRLRGRSASVRARVRQPTLRRRAY